MPLDLLRELLAEGPMNRDRNLRMIFTLGMLALVLAACSPGPDAGGPTVWIDVPVNGLNVAEGEPVNIEGHASHASGIERVEVWADGALAATLEDLDAYGTLSTFNASWTPTAPGEHTLQAIAFTSAGEASEPDSARITVGLPTFAGPDLAIVSVEAVVDAYKGDTPICNTRVVYRNAGTAAIPGAFDIKFAFDGVDQHTMTVAGGLPSGSEAEAIFIYQFDGVHYVGVNLDWSEAVAETNEMNNAFAEARRCEATAPPTATIVPPGEPMVRFVANPPEIQAGGCTTLRWEVEGAEQVIFGGIAQPTAGSYKDCLCAAQRYTLRVVDQKGVERRYTVDIPVKGECATVVPSDTTPPSVPVPSVPSAGLGLSCRSSQTVAWLPASDDSGIQEYRVQVQRHSGDNSWADVSGSAFTGVDGKQMELDVDCGWYYRYRVRAVDEAGNVSDWSAWSSFAITLD
jgi:hypothetical protein